MNQLTLKAKELLRHHSKEFVLNKLIREKTPRQSVTNINKAVEEAFKNLNNE